MRVLLVHRLNLGDLVCASPGLQWFQARHPGARYRLFTNDFSARVGALLPQVEAVYPYRKFGSDAPAELPTLWKARRWRPDRVIGLSPAKDWRLSIRTALLGGGIQHPDETAVHTAERLAHQFGWDGRDPLPPARLRPPEAARPKRHLAFAIAARRPSNRPTPQQVLAVIRLLRQKRPDLVIDVFGLPRKTASAAHLPEERTQDELQRALAAMNVGFLAPGLESLLLELACSDSVIAPDGGAAHIAAAFGKPTVALFGNVDPAAWRPYSDAACALQPKSRHVADLAAQDIADAWTAISRNR